MADLIDIEFGDQRLRVPAWATEATLEAVMKYNEITARALNKLVGVSSDGKKTFRVQEHYFKEIVTELQKSKKKQEELVKQNNTIIKDSKTKTSTTRAKDKSASNTATNFDKKMSELSKNYSTSITLVEGSLLYLSKSLIDLNLVIKETSDIYKTMLRGTRRISKVFNTGENSDVTRTSNRQPQRDSKIFRRERRDLSFKSLFTSFVEDLIEKQEKSLPLEFTNEEYMKGVNDLKKAIKAGNTKGLLDQYIKVLNEAVTQVSEGKTPTEQTIKNLEDALNDFSIFNREYTSVTERLLKHYVTDKSLSPTEKSNKQSYEVFKAIVNTQEKLANAVKQTTNGLVSLTGSAMTTGITFSKVTDMVSKIAGAIPILGGILAGVTAVGGAVLEEYMNGLKNLSGVSAGLGYDLLQLTQFSHDAGMTLADFSKLVSENGKAIKALGNSTTSGMVEFSKLSNTLREKSQEFNQFGLTNNEYNEILIQEIELRRKSGMDSKAIYDSVNGSMNDLLYNTSQLAAMTGQDARQMRIKMNESRKNDATLNLAIRLLSENSTVAAENIESFMGIMQRGGDSAIEIGNQMLRSAQFGESFSVVLKNLPEELRSAVVQDIGSFQEVFDFMSDNIKSMPTEEFNAKLASMIAELSNKNLTDEIGRQANIGITGFQKLVEMSSNFAGLNKSVEENAKVAAAAGQAAKDAAWMAIPSELQNTANAIKESILAETLKQLGIDTDATGKVFVEKLRELNSNIENNGLLKTATDTAMSGVGNFISEHPIISSVVGLAGLAGLGGGISTMLKTITTTGSIVANAGKGFLKFAGFNLASTAGPSAAAKNMMSFAGAQTGAQTGANLVDDAARIAAGSSTGAQTGANLVDDAARIAAGSSTGAQTGANLVDDAAGAGAAGGGKLLQFTKNFVPLIGDILMGYAEGSETGSVGRGIFGGVGSFLGRLGLAAAGTATTGIGGVVTQAAGGYAGANIGSGIYDWIFGESNPESTSTTLTSSIPQNYDSDYLQTLAVASNTTNVWLQTLTGFSENIRDDISQIKTNGGIKNDENLTDLLATSTQNSEAMISLMAETNMLLQRLIRKYDENANN